MSYAARTWRDKPETIVALKRDPFLAARTRERSSELDVYSKAWPMRSSKCFHKQVFALDWERQVIRCAASWEMPFVPGGVVHFPKDTCAQRSLKTQCTTSAKGQSVSIHPDEALLKELRERQQTLEGRTRLREQVAASSIRLHMSVDGKDGAHAIEACAKTPSICTGAQSSTICMSWLVLGQDKPSFRSLLGFLTCSLAGQDGHLAGR